MPFIGRYVDGRIIPLYQGTEGLRALYRALKTAENIAEMADQPDVQEALRKLRATVHNRLAQG